MFGDNNQKICFDGSGSWQNEDPAGYAGGDPNLYRFAGNDPANFADPTGLSQVGHPLAGGYSGNKVATKPTVPTGTFGGLPRTLGNAAVSAFRTFNPLASAAIDAGVGLGAAAAYGPVWDKFGEPGHHPVPQAVVKNLNSKLTPDAVNIFKRATSGKLPYDHAGDPWKGVSHQQYNDSVESLLRDYGNQLKQPVNEQQARHFVAYIEQGEIAKDVALRSAIKANKNAVSAVNTWRAGFIQSVIEGSTAVRAAAELKIELSNGQVKAIAQQRVNGAVTSGLEKHLDTPNVRAVERHLSKLAQAGRLGNYAAGALKKAAPALAIMSAANAYANGSRNGHRGLLGAADQSIADLMSADLAEDYVLRPGITKGTNFVEQNLGGGIPNQRVRRGGFDAAGRPIGDR
jgi:hypothetical protein